MAEDKKNTESKEEFVNPIDPDKITENPGLLPYAHTVGGVAIKPEDQGKIKGRAMGAMRQQTERQMEQLYDQMRTLANQAKGLQKRVEVSEQIYKVGLRFDPIMGHTYYLYQKKDGTDTLSLLSPEEWGRSFPYSHFVASAELLYDHTWDVKRVAEEEEQEGEEQV